MALEPGSRLGGYHIISALGAGGMGEVYRARDTSLQRDVAIKILPDLFASDRDRLARFEREAHLLAALNHPNIAHVYGLDGLEGQVGQVGQIGRVGTVPFIVMELVEGVTLAERCGGRALPLDETLPIARQIADALECAHEQGIIHRDLKPANIKVRDDGTVKVLDFGLAKLASTTPGSAGHPFDATASPTMTTPAVTGVGVLLGTAAYMAPEQAKGKPIDKRADIWAFGAVVYEMLTGRAAFDGETVTDVLAAIVTRAPDLNALPAGTPKSISTLLRRCLERDPKQRLRDIGEARVALSDALLAERADDEHVHIGPPRRSAARLMWLAAVAVAMAALSAAAAWKFKPTAVVAATPIARFSVPLRPGQMFGNLSAGAQLAISPDGTKLAYAIDAIYIRDLDQLEIRRVAQTPGTTGLAFSPDGRWLAFSTIGGLVKVRTEGGAPVPLGAFTTGDPSWSEADTILFTQGTQRSSRVMSLPAAGGTPQTLFTVDPPTLAAWPQMLPGGRFILYSETSGGEQVDAVVRSIDGRDRTVVLRNAPGARYVPTGHLVYATRGRLMAAPFDLDGRRVTGEPIQLSDAVHTSVIGGVWQASWSSTGTLIHMLPINDASMELLWVDRSGKSTPAIHALRQYSDPRLAPDGARVAVHVQSEQNDVWVSDLARGASTRLTFESTEDETPVWSPDGRYVAYASSRADPARGVYRRAADGSGPEELLWKSPTHCHVMDWSPDGTSLVIGVLNAGTLSDVLLLDLGTKQVRPLLQSKFNDRFGRISPDGKWIAYSSDETGREEIYVQPFPALGARVQVSTDGGSQPIWSRAGRELFYRGPRDMMAASVTSTSPLTFDASRALFGDRFEKPQIGDHITYDVAPDGRFLMIATAEQPQGSANARSEIHVVINWFDELRRLAKAGAR